MVEPQADRYASRDQAFQLLQSQMTSNGRICILADGNIEPLTLAPTFHEKELRIVGSGDGRDYPGYARWFYERIRQQSPPLEKLYEMEIKAADLPQAFAHMANSEQTPIFRCHSRMDLP